MVGGLYALRPDARHWMVEVDRFLRSFRARRTQLEFLRRLDEHDEKEGFFSDMAHLLRKGYYWGVTVTKSAFISPEEYRQFINPLIPDMNIEELSIPFACVATDIRNGKRVVFQKGSLRHAISASSALPGVFPPVTDGNQLLVDGGWVERVPIQCAFDLGAHAVIAIDVSGDLVDFSESSGLDIIMRADAVTRVYLNEIMLAQADLVLHPAVNDIHWADFSNPTALYARGEEAARKQLQQIRLLHQHTNFPRSGLLGQIRGIKERLARLMG
jgi:NTE family protein